MRRYVCFPYGLYHHTYMVVRGGEAEDEVMLRGSYGASIRHRSSPSKTERQGCAWAMRLFWDNIRKPTRWSRLFVTFTDDYRSSDRGRPKTQHKLSRDHDTHKHEHNSENSAMQPSWLNRFKCGFWLARPTKVWL